MTDTVNQHFLRNLQDVFDEGDAGRRLAAIKELFTDDSVAGLSNGCYVGHDAFHPDMKGFGANGRMFFWLRRGKAAPGATGIHPPGPQLHYDPRYYAAQVGDMDGRSLEFVYKS